MGLIIKLDIPEMIKGTEYYTVEPGDSLTLSPPSIILRSIL